MAKQAVDPISLNLCPLESELYRNLDLGVGRERSKPGRENAECHSLNDPTIQTIH